jgi:hypothetical protein
MDKQIRNRHIYIYIYIHTCNNSSSPANIMDTDRYETAIYTHTHVLLITNRILVYPTCNNSSPPLVYIQCVLIKRACCVRACTTRVFLGVSKGLCEKNIKNGIFAKSTSLHDFPYMLSLTCIYYLESKVAPFSLLVVLRILKTVAESQCPKKPHRRRPP